MVAESAVIALRTPVCCNIYCDCEIVKFFVIVKWGGYGLSAETEVAVSELNAAAPVISGKSCAVSDLSDWSD